jgi:ATP phosphoribosyltransferase
MKEVRNAWQNAAFCCSVPTMITIALSKGRLLDEALPILRRAGIALSISPDDTRQLIIPAISAEVQFLVLRATDVPTFVRYGAAQLGICGKDMLMEQVDMDVFQPVDLPFGYCRLSLALPAHRAQAWQAGIRHGYVEPLRIATKYPLIAQAWFAKRQQSVHLIKLYGSMEIAPAVGLADGIVDLVSSGATLRDNQLLEVEKIADINAKLIVNRAALKTQSHSVNGIIHAITKAILAPVR